MFQGMMLSYLLFKKLKVPSESAGDVNEEKVISPLVQMEPLIVQDHISCKGEEVLFSSFETVLHANLNDICTPIYSSIPTHLFAAVFTYLQDTFKFLDSLHLLEELEQLPYWKNLKWENIKLESFPSKNDQSILDFSTFFLEDIHLV